MGEGSGIGDSSETSRQGVPGSYQVRGGGAPHQCSQHCMHEIFKLCFFILRSSTFDFNMSFNPKGMLLNIATGYSRMMSHFDFHQP